MFLNYEENLPTDQIVLYRKRNIYNCGETTKLLRRDSYFVGHATQLKVKCYFSGMQQCQL